MLPGQPPGHGACRRACSRRSFRPGVPGGTSHRDGHPLSYRVDCLALRAAAVAEDTLREARLHRSRPAIPGLCGGVGFQKGHRPTVVLLDHLATQNWIIGQINEHSRDAQKTINIGMGDPVAAKPYLRCLLCVRTSSPTRSRSYSQASRIRTTLASFAPRSLKMSRSADRPATIGQSCRVWKARSTRNRQTRRSPRSWPGGHP